MTGRYLGEQMVDQWAALKAVLTVEKLVGPKVVKMVGSKV